MIAEQVRNIASEIELLRNTTEYHSPSTSWDTLHDYGNVTVPQAGMVMFVIGAHRGVGGGDGYLRLKVGSKYLWAHVETSGGVSTDHTVSCYLNAGTYDILVEGRYTGAGECSVDKMICGFVDFTDLEGSYLNTYSSTVSVTPTDRITCLGALKESVFRVSLYAITPSGQTNFENVGDSLTNGVSLAVDGSQVDFDVRNQDTGTENGASAEFFTALSVGDAHTFAITKDNANTVVNISIASCPWLLYDTKHQPIDLDVPQDATVYVDLEPLDGPTQPTKYLYIGKPRAYSYGDSTDFYYTNSGTEILESSYTFELIDGSVNLLYVKGSANIGGCISHIGIDIR